MTLGNVVILQELVYIIIKISILDLDFIQIRLIHDIMRYYFLYLADQILLDLTIGIIALEQHIGESNL